MNKSEVKALIASINKTHGDNTILVASQAVGLKYIRSSTGSFGLDIGTGGGFCFGRVHMLIGKESATKTATSLAIIANIQNTYKDAWCAYIDGEHSFDSQKAMDLGVDLERLLLVTPDSLEQAGDVIQELLEEKVLKNLTIDSWASLFVTKEYEGDMDDNQMGKNALAKNKLMRKIIGAVKSDMLSEKPSCMIVIINHITLKIGVMFGSPDTDSGGVAKNYFSSIRVKLTYIGKITKQINGIKHNVGIKVKWSVIKNKTSAPHKEGEFQYYYTPTKECSLGIDNVEEMMGYAKKHKMLPLNAKRTDFIKKYEGDSLEEFIKEIHTLEGISDAKDKEGHTKLNKPSEEKIVKTRKKNSLKSRRKANTK